MQAIQGGNWQRAGGKGKAPQRVERPVDRPGHTGAVRTAQDLVARRAAQQSELARRRRQKNMTSQRNKGA